MTLWFLMVKKGMPGSSSQYLLSAETLGTKIPLHQNVEAQCAMDHAKPGNQENSAVALPSWWLKIQRSSHPKKINMYIVGCFDSHFAIDSNWPVREKEQVLIRMHPGSPEICLISRYGLTMSWVAWVGVGKRHEKERGFFFSILHNVGSMTKNLCKSFKSCCTKIGSKDLATSNDKVLKSRRQKMVHDTATDHCENSKTGHSQKTVLPDLPFLRGYEFMVLFPKTTARLTKVANMVFPPVDFSGVWQFLRGHKGNCQHILLWSYHILSISLFRGVIFVCSTWWFKPRTHILRLKTH